MNINDLIVLWSHANGRIMNVRLFLSCMADKE